MSRARRQLATWLYKPLTVDCTGIPFPSYPNFSEEYFSYEELRIAFVGIETKGNQIESGDLEVFKKRARRDPNAALFYWTDEFDTNYLENVYGANFHGFIFDFLAQLHGVGTRAELKKRIRTDLKHIMNSFIWANSNLIERFGVTANKRGVEPKTYHFVKQASRNFDYLYNITETLEPDISIVLNKSPPVGYFETKRSPIHWQTHTAYIQFGYTESGLVVHMPHPRFLPQIGGPKMVVGQLLELLKQEKLT